MTTPNLLLALTRREQAAPAVSNEHSLWIPALASYQVTAPLSLGAAIGFKTPLESVADRWLITAGVVGGYKLDPGRDYRWLQLWVTWTR